MLLSGHPIPATVNSKALNQYDFPSSDEELSSQVCGLKLLANAKFWGILMLDFDGV